jgi:hypothetical protein
MICCRTHLRGSTLTVSPCQVVIASWFWPFGSSEAHKELQSANERIKDLVKLVSERDASVKELRAELATAKAETTAALQQASEKHREEIERLKRAHEDGLVATREVYDQRVASLQTERSELEMRLGNSEKQRIALQGVVDQPDRLKLIEASNWSVERAVWFILFVIGLALSGILASKYFQLRAKRRDDIVRLIGQLNHQTP